MNSGEYPPPQNPQQPPKTETLVKTYKSAKEFEKDAKHMAKQGWSPANIMNHQPDRSLAGKLLVPVHGETF